ncbi:TPA: aminotransferase class V-fold PLP-dependent enzyme [Candidatus Gracilibacteria bacterium]|nr:aminotransferase class V-fold PLP-dependent enzyme [Candidatus Peregrinibacteria bacterium]HIQ56627.1 aminotransferase class V-fold PLP-dependent enzyme [Candidatus Gracilibacteria bacterium]HIQ57381.1 aminotransferase class V-fold PLP-dependent enzyme [Candidatus Gracilibacteria bacterium]
MNYKKDFPIFKNNPNLIFLDSAASSQKPLKVLEDVKYFCENNYANVHRGAYSLSLQSTESIETARTDIAKFFGTQAKNLVFTKNATESSNIFISGIVQHIQSEHIEILMPVSEHHSSLLPALAHTKNPQNLSKITVKYIYPNASGIFTEDDFEKNITKNTQLIICAHISNVTGQIFDIKKISNIIKNKQNIYKNNIYFAVDASQSAPHVQINFDALSKISCDAMFITGHKIGAGGIGALLLSDTMSRILPQYSVGGGIVKDVHEQEYSLLESPTRFEAGTPSIENIVGFQSAIKYLENITFKKIQHHEEKLMKYALEQFAKKIPHFIIIGDKNITKNRSSLISFYHKNIHHSDIAILLAEKNIAVRAGMHCANPLHHYLHSKGTVRASFWIYNDISDIDALISGLQEIEQMFQ